MSSYVYGRATRVLFAPATVTVTAGLFTQFLTLLSGMLTARMVGVEGRGLVAAATIAGIIMASLGDLGGPISYTYLRAKGQFSSESLIANAWPSVFCQAVISVVIASLISVNAFGLDSSQARFSVYFAVIYIPFQMLARYLNALNQGEGRFLVFNIARASGQATNVVLLTVGLLTDNRSVEWCIGSIALGALTMVGLAAFGQKGHFRLRNPSIDVAKVTYSYGLRAHIGTVSLLDSYRLDLAFVLFLLSPFEGGLYSVAIGVASLIRAQATTVGFVIVPSVASKQSFSEQLSTAKRSAVLTISGVAVLGIILALWISPLLRAVYGEAFVEGATVTRILLFAMLLGAMRQTIQDSARGLGWPAIGSKAELATWVACAALLPPLVHFAHLNGAAWAMSLAYFVGLIVAFVLFRQEVTRRTEDSVDGTDAVRQTG